MTDQFFTCTYVDILMKNVLNDVTFLSGMCRLYKHKTTSKHRLVLRNAIGKVQLNVAISSGMTFTKELKDAKKGKRAFVKFTGIEDVNEGPRPIVFEVGAHDLDEFYSKLVALKE